MSGSGDAPANFLDSTSDEQTWSCEEIERLYRQALDAVEAVADDLNSASRTLSMDAEADADEPSTADTEASASPSRPPSAAETPPVAEEARPDPVQVIEALLFVGGQPLTAKTICGLLRAEFDAAFVEQAIEQIERRYARQNRPYEIHRGEGGYRIVLRADYESLRNQVYGFGPKQVRLSQEVLEILAIVAYRQPISRQKTEEIARRNPGAALRQLMERGLLILDRPDGTPAEEARYRTSARFLQLFGVARLDELPQIEDLNFK